MVGTQTIVGTSEEHLGRRKPEGALALADARPREGEWRAHVRSLREEFARATKLIDAWTREANEGAGEEGASEKRGTIVPIGTFVPAFSNDPRHPSRHVAFVEPVLAIRADALALASPPVGSANAARGRICSSLTPDAVRAALADLGDLSQATAWISEGDSQREELARGLGFARVEKLPADEIESIFSPAALALASLRGADLSPVISRAQAALDGWHTNELLEECPPFRLGAILAGLSARGAHSVLVAAPSELSALAAWIESAAASLPEKSRFAIFAGEPLDLPELVGSDRLIANVHVEGAQAPAQLEQASRARRLIGAGVPLIQLALSSIDAIAGELARWELALSFAGARGFAMAREVSTGDAGAAETHAAFAAPALREGPLAIHAATPTHAYILSKVAGTLGKKAEMSVHHWIAAQLAMGDPGEFVSLHWLSLPTQTSRAALAELQRALHGPNNLAVRVSFALPEFAMGKPLAGASSRGLYFLLSDGGGQDLLAGSSSLRQLARAAEERALALLGNTGRRAILLRAEDGDASKLIDALRTAGVLLAR